MAASRWVSCISMTSCAPAWRSDNLVLGGQAGDVGTGAPDPSPLDDRRLSPGPRQLPGQELAPLSTAEDQDFIPFRLKHARVRVPAVGRKHPS